MRSMSKKIKRKITTKAKTLEFLSNVLEQSRVLPLYYFSNKEWQEQSEKILADITRSFQDQEKIIVRSSAISEDTKTESNAGKYESFLNVNPNDLKQVKDSINKVFLSYANKNDTSQDSQVLIQQQLIDPEISGVIFTRETKNNLPYYLVNYDSKSGNTDTVTSGIASEKIYILKNIDPSTLPVQWKNLIIAVKEVESLYTDIDLDIEFGIKDNQIYLFQSRPLILTVPKQVDDELFFRYINKLAETSLDGMHLSNMAFWNPAEIIGEKPKTLAASLYTELILKKAWNDGISILGYTKVKDQLSQNILGRVYIRSDLAFLSMLPEKLNKKIKEKLLKLTLKRLQSNPNLHDKVEFSIVPNNFNFSLNNNLHEWYGEVLDVNEINEIVNELKDITVDAIKNSQSYFAEARKKARIEISYDKVFKSPQEKIAYALDIFYTISENGATEFAKIARLGFIAKALFDSLKTTKCISEEEYNNVISSITTIASNIFINPKDSDHLRSGTYDITSISLKETILISDEFNKNSDYSIKNKNDYILCNTTLERIKQLCIENNFDVDPHDLIEFSIKAQIERENIKYLFTKDLSYVIDLIAEAGNELGFSREQLSHLDIEILNESVNSTDNDIKNNWALKIANNKGKQNINDLVILPDCIFTNSDLILIQYPAAKPNFITNRIVKSDPILLDQNLENLEINIKNKIVLVKSADPGYDWIFSHNIAGLITEYGGVASHMAIRCNEFNIPAALGVGNTLFDKCKSSSEVILDCATQKLTIN